MYESTKNYRNDGGREVAEGGGGGGWIEFCAKLLYVSMKHHF